MNEPLEPHLEPGKLDIKRREPEASSTMRVLSGARCTDVRLYTLRIKNIENTPMELTYVSAWPQAVIYNRVL